MNDVTCLIEFLIVLLVLKGGQATSTNGQATRQVTTRRQYTPNV